MRFLRRRLQQLEQQQEEARTATMRAGARWQLVWSSDEARVDPVQLQPGEHVAADVVAGRSGGDVVVWRVVERISATPGDLGVVRDEAGGEIGRVVRLAPEWIEVEYGAAAGADLPVSVPRR